MLFNTTTHPSEDNFSDTTGTGAAHIGGRVLWNVDHRLANNPSLQFQQDTSPLFDHIIETGGDSPMSRVPIPQGLVRFLEQKFLPVFNLAPSKYSPIQDVIKYVWQYLDYEEPYFYFIDMPVQLTQSTLQYTFRHKKTGSVLDPKKTEVFEVMRGWEFKPYWAVHDIVTHEVTKRVMAGERLPHATEPRYLNVDDILTKIAAVVYGGYDWFRGTVEQWIWNYSEDLIFDARTGSNPQLVDEIETSLQADMYFWYVVTLGTMAWLKSPHGLKFLAQYHPVYYEVLEWDEDVEKIVISKDTGGIAIVEGWSIFTLRDVLMEVSEPPGTCCILKQQLHCVKLVNVPAVKSRVCYCGKELEILAGDYYGDHYTPACTQWRREHPQQDAFVSYGAMYNLLSGLDASTKCPDHKCPNTKCNLHAGNYMRIRALTEQRVRMIPQRGTTH